MDKSRGKMYLQKERKERIAVGAKMTHFNNWMHVHDLCDCFPLVSDASWFSNVLKSLNKNHDPKKFLLQGFNWYLKGCWNSLMHAPSSLFIAEISGNAYLQPLDLYPLSSERKPSAPSATEDHPTASVQNLISWPCWYSQFEQGTLQLSLSQNKDRISSHCVLPITFFTDKG